MRTIAFVIPYFGKLPPMFPLWLASCRQNPSVDFLLFTDDRTAYDYPENVRVEYTTFEAVRQLLQDCFDFPIALTTPYKLCDYKPVYGKAFARWLEGYDFWGHCDIDLVWGDIRHFFTEELLAAHERILWQGHCSVYRNCQSVNSYYRTLDPRGCMDWRTVYTTEANQSFDEYAEHNGGGLSLIMERNGVPMYREWIFADLCLWLRRFQLSYTENAYYTTDADSRSAFFLREEDSLFLIYRKNGQLRRKEFLYAHFQKRPVRLAPGFTTGTDRYLILPPGKVRPLTGPLSDRQLQKQLRRNDYGLLLYDLFNDLTAVQLCRRALRKAGRILKR